MSTLESTDSRVISRVETERNPDSPAELSSVSNKIALEDAGTQYLYTLLAHQALQGKTNALGALIYHLDNTATAPELITGLKRMIPRPDAGPKFGIKVKGDCATGEPFAINKPFPSPASIERIVDSAVKSQARASALRNQPMTVLLEIYHRELNMLYNDGSLTWSIRRGGTKGVMSAAALGTIYCMLVALGQDEQGTTRLKEEEIQALDNNMRRGVFTYTRTMSLFSYMAGVPVDQTSSHVFDYRDNGWWQMVGESNGAVTVSAHASGPSLCWVGLAAFWLAWMGVEPNPIGVAAQFFNLGLRHVFMGGDSAPDIQDVLTRLTYFTRRYLIDPQAVIAEIDATPDIQRKHNTLWCSTRFILEDLLSYTQKVRLPGFPSSDSIGIGQFARGAAFGIEIRRVFDMLRQKGLDGARAHVRQRMTDTIQHEQGL